MIPMTTKTPPAPPAPTVDFAKPMQVSDLETPTHGFEMDANTHESAN
jgi:hypothetical protein